MEQTEKQLRKTIGEAWTNARAYFGAVGISGALVAETSNRIARVLDDALPAETRHNDGNKVLRLSSPLVDSLDALHALTNGGHDYAAHAANELRTMNTAIDALQHALYARAA